MQQNQGLPALGSNHVYIKNIIKIINLSFVAESWHIGILKIKKPVKSITYEFRFETIKIQLYPLEAGLSSASLIQTSQHYLPL